MLEYILSSDDLITDESSSLINSIHSTYDQNLENYQNYHSIDAPTDLVTGDSSRYFLWNASRNQMLILLCLFLVDLTSQMCLSLMAPFFPDEAISKGISNSMSGWIFGTFALVQFLTSPIFGKFLPHVGSRFLIINGQFLAAGSFILFGLLDEVESSVDNHVTFATLAFLLRITLAIGCTSSSTASFVITASVFPDNVSAVFGLLETATGLGLMIGPAVGGLLYQNGGFIVPFAVVGGFMLLTVFANIFCLSNFQDSSKSTGEISYIKILCESTSLVICLTIFMSAFLWSILDPTLAPHLETRDISSSIIGLLFLLMSAFYAIFSPIWGWVAERIRNSLQLIAIGFVMSGLALLLLGHSPLLGLDPNNPLLPVDIFALAVLGLSISLALIPTFDSMLETIESAGYPSNFQSYCYVASIWGGCFALGDFVGPLVGGILSDYTTFDFTMTYTAIACFIMAGICMIFSFCRSGCNKNINSLTLISHNNYDTLPDLASDDNGAKLDMTSDDCDVNDNIFLLTQNC